jgi:hypothetical protein
MDENELIEELILKGALEVVGFDSDNKELLYSITEKMKEIMPEVYDDHMNFVNRGMLDLWEKGFIDIDFLKEDPMVTLTEKASNKQELAKLTKEEVWSINELRRLLMR